MKSVQYQLHTIFPLRGGGGGGEVRECSENDENDSGSQNEVHQFHYRWRASAVPRVPD